MLYIKSDLQQIRKISIPVIENTEGNLCFLQNFDQIPFEIKRVFYTFGMNAASVRGGHAHKNLHQFIIAVHGSFLLIAKDGKSENCFWLSNPIEGYYIPPGIWIEIQQFSENAVCLVLTSDFFLESDYIRSYSDFLIAKKDDL